MLIRGRVNSVVVKENSRMGVDTGDSGIVVANPVHETVAIKVAVASRGRVRYVICLNVDT